MRSFFFLAFALSIHITRCQPTVELGGQALSFTVCYHNGMDSSVAYHDSGVGSLALRFCAGQMETCCDEVVVYDGSDNTAPVLYWGNGVEGDLTDLFIIATSPWITLQIISNDTISCESEVYTPLEWVAYEYQGVEEECLFLSLEERQTTAAMTVTPSLTTGAVTIAWTTDAALERVDAYDASGRALVGYLTTGLTVRMDVQNLADGSYLVVGTEEDGHRSASRFVLQRW